ncbi:MAG: hypothetical protein JJU42_04730 [Rhodobacteraceae bacterium]|nr:hypothetical protein [Paracoccaceae bacterium]
MRRPTPATPSAFALPAPLATVSLCRRLSALLPLAAGLLAHGTPLGADEAGPDLRVPDPRVIAAFAETAAECAAMGGTLEIPPDPVTMVDLTGDGVMDMVVSEAGAFCGPDLGYFGGSGGSRINVVIGAHIQHLHGGAWAVQDVAFEIEGETMPPVRHLLIARHGSACDSFGAAPCLEAFAWDGERMISVAPLPE